MICDKCGLVTLVDQNFNTFDNMLTLTASGGYGEYVDSAFIKPENLEFNLCHKCAHRFMKRFLHVNTTRWHPRTKDRYCDGWVFQ